MHPVGRSPCGETTATHGTAAAATGLDLHQRQETHVCDVCAIADWLKLLIVQCGGNTIERRSITAELEPRQARRIEHLLTTVIEHPFLPITVAA